MSNAAVKMNTILRIHTVLLREGNSQCAAFLCHDVLKPHVISGKGNGIRY